MLILLISSLAGAVALAPPHEGGTLITWHSSNSPAPAAALTDQRLDVYDTRNGPWNPEMATSRLRRTGSSCGRVGRTQLLSLEEGTAGRPGTYPPPIHEVEDELSDLPFEAWGADDLYRDIRGAAQGAVDDF